MSAEWMTAAEIAALKLPALPHSEFRVREAARASGWDVRPRAGAGGGREYAVASLPEAARRALAAREARRARALAPVAPPAAAELKGWQRAVQDARAAILLEVSLRAAVMGIGRARESVVSDALAGRLRPDLQMLAERCNARRGEREALSVASLRRWQGERERAGTVTALAPRAAPEETAPDWLEPLMRTRARPSKISLPQAIEQLPAGVLIPSLRTVQRTIAALPAQLREAGRLGPRAMKALKAYVVRDTSDLWPTAVYTADGHTLDAEVQHPMTGGPFRPEVTSIVDVKTRRVVGWSAALAENTWGTLDALRHACTTAGVCDIWYVDRGKGFNNKVFDGARDAAETGLMARLGITKLNSLPYNSQARGVIERLHQSVWVRGARLLPTYVGEDMDREARERANKRTRADVEVYGTSPLLMPWSEFLSWAQAQVDAYNDRPHSSLPKVGGRHLTPNEAWAAAIASGWSPDILPVEDAADLYRPQIQRKVSRGQVRLFGNTYFASALEPHHEREVLVGYDIHDPMVVWVRDLDQRLICEARWGANRQSYMPISVVEAAHERRVDAQLARVAVKAASIEETRRPRLVEAVSAPIDPMVEARAAALAEKLAPKVPVPRPEDAAAARYDRALALEAAIAAGEDVSDNDRRWVRGYRTTAECRAQAAFRQMFAAPLARAG